MIKAIAFDADDTLWENEALYQLGRARFQKILEKYGIDELPEQVVDQIEIGNLKYYGYGAMGFVLSLIETAIELTDGQISGTDMLELIRLGKDMLSAEIELFEHAEATILDLHNQYPLILITKGDLNHQLSKVARSGLQRYFQAVEVVHDKTPEIYAQIFARYGYLPAQVMMVGNSLRSDILPVLELGCTAVYIPNHIQWAYEIVEIPEGCNGRCHQLDHLGQLPELLKNLNSRVE